MSTKKTRYQPKPENRPFAVRLKEALRDADMSQSDLSRELARRGLYSAESKSAISNWVRGVNRPDQKHLEVIAAILGKKVAYFTDPQYDQDFWQAVGKKLIQVIADSLVKEETPVAQIERQAGTQLVLETDDRRSILRDWPAVRDAVRAAAPGAFAALAPHQLQELCEALVRGDIPVTPAPSPVPPSPPRRRRSDPPGT